MRQSAGFQAIFGPKGPQPCPRLTPSWRRRPLELALEFDGRAIPSKQRAGVIGKTILPVIYSRRPLLKQTTFSTAGFDCYAKTTKRAAFLAEMERVVPWSKLCGLVEPFYPKGETGRRPFGVERMLRIYCLQNWFNLSDPAA